MSGRTLAARSSASTSRPAERQPMIQQSQQQRERHKKTCLEETSLGSACGVQKADPASASIHERAAERFRKAAERLREAGLHEGGEAAKRIAREEEVSATRADSEEPNVSPRRFLRSSSGQPDLACF